MAGFLETFKLGPPGYEITFGDEQDQPLGFEMTIGPERLDAKNIIKENASSLLRRYGVDFSVTFDGIPEATMLALSSLSGRRDQEFAFIFADAWPLSSEQYSLNAAGTAFTMKSNSFLLLDQAYNTLSLARQVNLTGVYDDIEMRGAQVSTNRIASTLEESLDRATWICTLDTPGTGLADVNVNFTISGALVNLKGDIKSRKIGQHPTSGVNVYSVTVGVTGV